ncbi:hypothetical protein Q3G72_021815 [Acer saccharum]|nr:hypothetical protein Q3G72_021815 [Acer saccharum]
MIIKFHTVVRFLVANLPQVPVGQRQGSRAKRKGVKRSYWKPTSTMFTFMNNVFEESGNPGRARIVELTRQSVRYGPVTFTNVCDSFDNKTQRTKKAKKPRGGESSFQAEVAAVREGEGEEAGT